MLFEISFLFLLFMFAVNIWPKRESLFVLFNLSVNLVAINPETIKIAWSKFCEGPLESIQILFNVIRIAILEYIVSHYNLGSTQIISNKVLLKFHYQGKLHTLIYPYRRGPKPWISIYNVVENQIDRILCTNHVENFAGPFHNFYSAITPEQLGYNTLIFVLKDKTEKTFQKTDRIIF